MANAGFGPLIELKRHVLPDALRSKTTWDSQLTLIGKGVVASFERYCNRTFERAAETTYEFQGGVTGVVLPRYPLEAVTDLDLKLAGESTWDDYNDSLANWDAESGIVEFEIIMGSAQDKVRVSYTGGYWWETAETEDTSQPAGSTAIPDELKNAWAMQVQAEIENRNLIGVMGARVDRPQDKSPSNKLRDHGLLDAVTQVLNAYRRYG